MSKFPLWFVYFISWSRKPWDYKGIPCFHPKISKFCSLHLGLLSAIYFCGGRNLIFFPFEKSFVPKLFIHWSILFLLSLNFLYLCMHIFLVSLFCVICVFLHQCPIVFNVLIYLVKISPLLQNSFFFLQNYLDSSQSFTALCEF